MVEQVVLAPGTDEAALGLAVLEKDKGRHRHHLIPQGGLGVGVDVDLDDLEAVGLLGGDVLQDRSDGLARSAPGGGEVDEDGSVGGPHDLVEGGVVELGHIRHDQSQLPSMDVYSRWSEAVRSSSRLRSMASVAPQMVSPTTSKKDSSRSSGGSPQRSAWYTPSAISSDSGTCRTRSTSWGLGTSSGRRERIPTKDTMN